jgi:tartrate-resistant acid phosphatase type 5
VSERNRSEVPGRCVSRTGSIILAIVAGTMLLQAQDSVRFAVVGDYGIAGQPEADVAALVQSWNPVIVVTTGDNNYPNGEASTIDANIGQYYHQFIHPYAGIYGPGSDTNRFFPSLGNHDWVAPGAGPYLDYFALPGNERYYDFTRGPVHFFAIDSDPSEPDGISSTSVQGMWLRDALAASTSRWKIVYMHHAPYSSSTTHGSTEVMQWPYREWGATAVLAGHDHTYERIEIGLFPYFVNGIGGNTIYSFGTPIPGSKVRYNSDYGAMLVNAYQDSIIFRCYSRAGTLVDSYLINPPSSPLVKVALDTISFVAEVGGIADTASFSVLNAGLDTLVITEVQAGGNNFHVITPSVFPVILPGYGDQVPVNVAFLASTEGTALDSLVILSNDPAHPVAAVTLSGQGLLIHRAMAGILYAAGTALGGELYTLDTATGQATVVGMLGVPEIHAMAIRPADRKVYGLHTEGKSTTLYRIDTQSGASVRTATIPLGDLRAISFSSDDTLFGASTSGDVYRIDATTGSPVLLGSNSGLAYSGLSFSPTSGELWASVRLPIDSIYTIDRTTGLATFVGTTGFQALTRAISFTPEGTLLALIDNGSGEDYLARLDTTTAAGSILAGPLPVMFLSALAISTEVPTDVREVGVANIPEVSELDQNYPNPFNPHTIIHYRLSTENDVSLKVFDLLGRQVAVLLNEKKSAGTYAITFDAAGLSSGVYIYRLTAGQYIRSRKMVLLR